LPDFALLVFRAYLHSQRFQRIAKWTTNIAHLGAQRFAGLEFPVPPLAEQKRIIAEADKHLTDLDAGVAALKRVQANLKRYRASVLKAACEGRLVPTEADLARAEGREYEHAKELLQRIKGFSIIDKRETKLQAVSEANAELESISASLPHSLPSGWVLTNLRQLKQFSLYGPRFSSDDYKSEGVFVLRTSDISESGKVNLDSAPRLALGAEELARYQLERGDLLVTRTGSLGTVAVFDDSVEAIPGAYLIQFRLRASLDTSLYVLSYLRSPFAQAKLVGGGAGVGRPNLNAPTIEAIPIPLPPLDEQKRILAAIARLMSIADQVEETLNLGLLRAERLRQSILKRAFEGKLVPQDPNDEPASVLLDRIRQERASPAGKPAPGQMSLDLEKPKKPRALRRRSAS
jgi:type I restriction enzyme S subunit